MRFSIFAILALVTALSFFQCIHAVPVGSGQLHTGEVTFKEWVSPHTGPLVTITDANKKAWFADKGRELYETMEVGQQVTFTTRLTSKQTAFDVKKAPATHGLGAAPGTGVKTSQKLPKHR